MESLLRTVRTVRSVTSHDRTGNVRDKLPANATDLNTLVTISAGQKLLEMLQ